MRQSCLARRRLGAPQLSGSRVRHGVVIVSLEFAMLHTHVSVTDCVHFLLFARGTRSYTCRKERPHARLESMATRPMPLLLAEQWTMHRVARGLIEVSHHS
jgi:hypothetical protein